jgi:hypothetical protein
MASTFGPFPARVDLVHDGDTCWRGHPRTPENTYQRANGSRTCAVCVRESARSRYANGGRERHQTARQLKAQDPEFRVREAARSRERTRRLKADVIRKYGGVCECCEESEIRFLTIDHRNGGGCKEREAAGTGIVFYRRLQREVRRADLRVLCMNCNWATAHGEPCPHQTKGGDA